MQTEYDALHGLVMPVSKETQSNKNKKKLKFTERKQVFHLLYKHGISLRKLLFLLFRCFPIKELLEGFRLASLFLTVCEFSRM